jgi:FKBP-type peptidyl-prolyl cis-trans isomerase SlyD
MNHGQKNQFALAAVSIAAILAIFGCKPSTVQKGKLVTMNYTLFVDSAVVDSSVGKKPLTFIEGSGQIIPGLDEQLTGLKIGDKKHVVVPPEKGYGAVNPRAVQKVPLSAFGNTKGLKPGMMVGGTSQGRRVQAKVVSIAKDTITLDMNPPLAGKTLTFDIEIMDITKAPQTATQP